jgi:hypothetical protein
MRLYILYLITQEASLAFCQELWICRGLWHPKVPEHPLSGVGVVPMMTPRVGQLVSRLLRNLIQMGDDERDRPRKTAQGELNDGTWPMSSLIGTATWGATLTLMPSIFFRNL